MVGNWKTSLIMGLIALVLWTVAYTWYFIGNDRIWRAWKALRARLGFKKDPRKLKNAR